MGTKERREREREEMREAIVDAAREMFATEGYEAVTMRRIAEKIEYSATAIYFHFKDKQAVIRAICDTDFLALAQQFQRIARQPDPIERLRKSGQAYIELGLKHPNHYRLMFMTSGERVEPEESELQQGNPEEDAYAFLVSIITEGMEKKRFKPDLKDPHLVAQIVWSGVHGIVTLEIALNKDKWIEWRAIKKRSDLMIDVLIAGLTGKRK